MRCEFYESNKGNVLVGFTLREQVQRRFRKTEGASKQASTWDQYFRIAVNIDHHNVLHSKKII